MSRRLLHLIVAGSILTFFLQAMRVVFSTLFGIIYDQIFEERLTAWLPVSNLLLILAILAPALAIWWRGRRAFAATAALAALARVALTINSAPLRYWASLIVLAAAGLYLAGLLTERRELAFAALVTALTLDQLLRAAGDTFDISFQARWLPMQIIWGLIVAMLAIWLEVIKEPEDLPVAGLMRLNGFALGAWFFLEASLLSLANGIARWSNASYAVIAPGLLAVTVLPLLPFVYGVIQNIGSSRRGRLMMALLLGLSLMAGYFLTRLVAAAALVAAQIIACTILLIIINDARPGRPSAGPSIAFGLFVFLILNFLNAFAFTYPYLFPFMRGMGWAAYLAAAILAGLGANLSAPATTGVSSAPLPTIPVAIGSLAALVLVTATVWPQDISTYPDEDTLRVATYNIHYGYDDEWHSTLEMIAQTIENERADIIAMQEVDTGRMTSYAADDAYFLARRLHMNVLYLPTVEHLTGIAILYRDPLIVTAVQLIPSRQEQTGIVLAKVRIGSQSLYAYGIWMGLEDEDTLTQISHALTFIDDSSPAVFGGDFNAEPDSPVALAVKRAGFVDPFRGEGVNSAPLTDPAPVPTRRIDFVWIRDLAATRAWVSDSLASDHRMVVVEVKVSR